jgi:hypothetical protein
MKQYQKLHIWMMLPFAIALLGFYFTYWSKFFEVPFEQHLHGLTATIWYLLLIIQPYLIRKGNIKSHRLYGMASLFIAGGVVFSAAQIIPGNFTNENLSDHLKYGLSFFDFLILIGFSVSVMMAIKTIKNTFDHVRWMVSTSFWALMPALSRMIYFPMLMIYGYPTPISFTLLAGLCGAFTTIILVVLMIRDKQAHIAFVLAALVNLCFFLLEPIGNWEWWINVCQKMI